MPLGTRTKGRIRRPRLGYASDQGLTTVYYNAHLNDPFSPFDVLEDVDLPTEINAALDDKLTKDLSWVSGVSAALDAGVVVKGPTNGYYISKIAVPANTLVTNTTYFEALAGVAGPAGTNGTNGANGANGTNGTTLPTQTGNANKYLQTDGTNLSWQTVVSGGSGGFSPYIDVVSYGADPTGAADSYSAIMAAYAAAGSAKKILYFPAGRYKSNTAIVWNNENVAIQGNRMGDYGVNEGASILFPGTGLTTGIFVLCKRAADDRPLAHFTMSNMCFDGVSRQGSSLIGLQIYSYNARVTDVRASAFSSHGIYIRGYTSAQIAPNGWSNYNSIYDRVLTTNCGGSGFYFGPYADDVVVRDIHSYDNARYGVEVGDGAAAPHINGANHIYSCTLGGILVRGGSVRGQVNGGYIESNAGPGIILESDANAGPTDWKFSNLRVWGNGNSSSTPGQLVGRDAGGNNRGIYGNSFSNIHIDGAGGKSLYGTDFSGNCQVLMVTECYYAGGFATATRNGLGSSAGGLTPTYRNNIGQ